MHPQAQQLFSGWEATFASADRAIRWRFAEQTLHKWLDERTCLIGTIDAIGMTEDGRDFFADWKTIGAGRARNMEQVKAEWRFDPQALTYGVLMDGYSTFTVRWAVKDRVPRYDFEWYTYSLAEVAWWRRELLRIADSIRALRASTPKGLGGLSNWPVNPTHCTRYGWAYRCPFYDNGCPKLNFAHNPSLPPRDHHRDTERELWKKETPDETFFGDVVFLSSSSVETWLGCQEKYRRVYEGDGIKESSEALTIGTDMHTLVAQHIERLIKEQNG